MLYRIPCVPERVKNFSNVSVSDPIVRVKGKDPLATLLSLAELPLLAVHGGQVVHSRCVVLVNSDCFQELLLCLIVAPLSIKGQAKVVPCVAASGVVFNGASVMFYFISDVVNFAVPGDVGIGIGVGVGVGGKLGSANGEWFRGERISKRT